MARLNELLCASCSAQVAPASWSLQVALCKSRSLQVALRKLLCASCSVQVALRKLLCASCSRQGALRKLVGASWSAQVALCNLLCASCSAQVAVKCKLSSCDAPADQGGIEPATRRFREQAPRDNSRGPARTTKVAKTSSFCTSTTPIPAEGCASTAEIAKNPWVFAPRPPQRVARVCWKSQKTLSFCTSTTPIPAEGRASTAETAKNHGFLHLDHADPRRGSREQVRNRKKPWVFAPQPLRSLQRVAQAG